jgi:uncharacterized protein (TIGR00251 family)
VVGTLDRLELTPVAGGRTRLRLRVRPGGRKDAILGEHGGALRVGVTAPPERGKANRAVEAVLAAALKIPVAAVEIVAGGRSADKVAVIDLDPRTLMERITRA